MATAMHDRTIDDNYLLVAALDFGTSYSGYAYSTRDDFKKNPNSVYSNQACNDGVVGLMSLKSPTCVLLNKDLKMVAFGYNAENEFMKVAAENKQSEYYFFQRFKMKLYESMLYAEIFEDFFQMVDSLISLLLSRRMQASKIMYRMKVEETGGKTMPAIDVFSLSIRALVDDLMKHLKIRGKDIFTIQDTKWVLTVPAIWSVKAKDFMRESAIKAGIPAKNLSIALEPECASVYCQYIPKEQLSGKSGKFSVSNTGTKYMIVDLGGGTADIAVHQKMAEHQLKELCRATGSDCGGTSIDSAFFEELSALFGEGVMGDLKKDTESFFLICRSFESVKRKIKSDTEGKISVSFPYEALSEYCKKHHGKTINDLISSSRFSEIITINKGHFRMQSGFLKELFEPTLKKLAHVLKNVFARELVQDVENIILVGGFAECELVQKHIQDIFPSKRIIVPEECGLAVLKGAVMFGHNPSCIGFRVVPFTYGISVAKPFDGSLHDTKHAFVHKGKMYCGELFEILVEKGTEVKTESRILKRISTCTQLICVNLYMSKSKHVTYVDEEDCALIKVSVFNIFNPSRRNRAVDLAFKFGETEITVQIDDALDFKTVPDILLSK